MTTSNRAVLKAALKEDIEGMKSWLPSRKKKSATHDGDPANSSPPSQSPQPSAGPTSVENKSTKRLSARNLSTTNNASNISKPVSSDYITDDRQDETNEVDEVEETTPARMLVISNENDGASFGIIEHYNLICSRVAKYLPRLWDENPRSDHHSLIEFVAKNSYNLLSEQIIIANAARNDAYNKLTESKAKRSEEQQKWGEEKCKLTLQHTQQQEKLKEGIQTAYRAHIKKLEETHANALESLRIEKDEECGDKLTRQRAAIDNFWRDHLSKENDKFERRLNTREVQINQKWANHMAEEKADHNETERILRTELLTEQEARSKDVRIFNEQLRDKDKERDAQAERREQWWNTEIAGVRRRNEAEQEKSHQQMKEAEEAARLAREALKREHEKARDADRRVHEGKVHELLENVSSYQEQIVLVNSDAQNAQQKLREEHTTALNKLRQEVKVEKEQLNAKYKFSTVAMEKKCLAEVVRAKEQYETKESQIMQQMHESSEALLARDDEKYLSATFTTTHLPRTADEHIKTQFFGVMSTVEDLSRIKWKEDRDLWTDGVLKKLGEQNERVLKKSIVQCCIWTILLEHVFCSPYRIFGDEGKNIEREWAEKCRTGNEINDPYLNNGIYAWPAPSVKTERWRYFTVHGCREALKPQPSDWDSRTHLKNGFNKNLIDTTKKIEDFLKVLADTNSETTRAIKLLIKSISNMWLEFGMNRCRLVIFFRDTMPKSVEEQIAEAEGGSLTLMTVPGIRRYGNAKGDDLNTAAVIEGCAGTTIKISQSSPV